MDEKSKSAYHEAGHALRSWDIRQTAFISVCLKLEDGEWEGETTLKKSMTRDTARKVAG
jgi:hypothetical protein